MKTDPSIGKAAETRGLLQSRGFMSITVAGGCMTPTLEDGQVVMVRRADAPRVGDVVLLDAAGWLEIHRLVGRIGGGRQSWFVHMGDASPICGVAAPRDILGIVQVSTPRRAPARRAHLMTLLLGLGALLLRLGLTPSRRWGRVLKSGLFGSA